MNTKLLLKVKAAILAEPRSFIMADWSTQDPESPCGTSACIGGWATALSRNPAKPNLHDSHMSQGPDLMELSPDGENKLCYKGMWPQPFKDSYEKAEYAEDRNAMAKAAADRIDHFIATEGRE